MVSFKCCNSETQKNIHRNKIIDNECEYTNYYLIAEKLNNLFANIGSTISDSIQNTNTNHFQSYLTDNYPNSFFLSPLSVEDTVTLIMNSKNKHCPVNVCPVTALKKVALLVAPVIADIINK